LANGRPRDELNVQRNCQSGGCRGIINSPFGNVLSKSEQAPVWLIVVLFLVPLPVVFVLVKRGKRREPPQFCDFCQPASVIGFK
ncbi:MAG: hypothetical protein P8K79_04890, partial [Mariniblastus sp.]|nr:hypothetical protein [Mariniblastus sp.]